MAPIPGKKADKESPFVPSWAAATGRWIGFLLLAGTGMSILAAVVLLPEYAALREDAHQRDLELANMQDLENLKAAHDRMLVALNEDPIFVERVALSMGGVAPADRQIADLGLSPSPPPGIVITQPVRRPAPPRDGLMIAATRLSNNATRRGLFLLSIGMLMMAFFFFGRN
ncbi:MAG: hypothetical protein GXY38_12045 [Planctomycetes bacterium]|nr:hypothetical protein [Planctomycetota bacterium]